MPRENTPRIQLRSAASGTKRSRTLRIGGLATLGALLQAAAALGSALWCRRRRRRRWRRGRWSTGSCSRRKLKQRISREVVVRAEIIYSVRETKRRGSISRSWCWKRRCGACCGVGRLNNTAKSTPMCQMLELRCCDLLRLLNRQIGTTKNFVPVNFLADAPRQMIA